MSNDSQGGLLLTNDTPPVPMTKNIYMKLKEKRKKNSFVGLEDCHL